MKYYLNLLFMLFFITAQATIYEWRDKEGTLHFTDSPKKGAKKIELPEVQTYTQEQTSEAPEADKANTQEEDTARDYESVTISSPEDQATIRNNNGTVNVLIAIEPGLVKGDKVQLLLDGVKIGKPQATTAFVLNDVFRGAHKIGAQIISNSDEVLATSEMNTFFMHRAIKGQAKQAP